MSEALKVLNNIRTLRTQARETDLSTLEEMLDKLTVIVEDRREEEASVQQKNAERQENPNVNLALLNTNIPMKMAMKNYGQVRGAHLNRLLLRLKAVKGWKILRSDYLDQSATLCYGLQIRKNKSLRVFE